MHRAFWTALAATALTFGAAGTATAAETTVVVGSCDSVTDGDVPGCLFSGNINGSTNQTADASYLNAQDAYNAFANSNLLDDVVPITLNWITKSDDANFGTFGSITGGGNSGTFLLPGWDIEYYAVKAGNEFLLFEYLDALENPDGSYNWVTNGRQGLSHIAFFGTRGDSLPEPGTWGMMLIGFAGIGMALRRRRRSSGQMLQIA